MCTKKVMDMVSLVYHTEPENKNIKEKLNHRSQSVVSPTLEIVCCFRELRLQLTTW